MPSSRKIDRFGRTTYVVVLIPFVAMTNIKLVYIARSSIG